MNICYEQQGNIFITYIDNMAMTATTILHQVVSHHMINKCRKKKIDFYRKQRHEYVMAENNMYNII